MTSEQREQVVAVLRSWDPAGDADLPDDVALALDADPSLRAEFDARFAAADLGEVQTPVGLAERVVPRRRRWGWVVGAGGLAAAALALLIPAAYVATVSVQSELASVSSELVVDAPTFTPTVDASLRVTAGDGTVDTLERDPLNALGYVVTTDIEGQIRPPEARDTFDDAGVSPEKITAKEPIGTFSIDVDRGSYTWTRGQLRAGRLPTPASVRTEEFVNALTYDPPRPDDGPFAVQFEGSPSPFSDREIVRITLAAREATVKKPVHLTFLVDTSGSMQGEDRLGLVKRSLSLLVDNLGEQDTVAIVAYAGGAGVVLEPTPATDRARIREALAKLEAGGSTAMGQGIGLAYHLAHDARTVGHENRVILASDGDTNVGVLSTGTLSEGIRGYALDGITLTTLGFGTGNYQDARMEQLANDGDGNYYYIDSLDEARHVFVDQLASTLEVVARDVKVQVEWNPETVQRWRQVGYENRALTTEQFRDDDVDAGEVGAGHTVTALFEVERVEGATGDLATVRLRGKPPGEDAESTEWAYRMPAAAVQPSLNTASADHRMSVAMGAFAEHLRGSPYAKDVALSEVSAWVRTSIRPGHDEDRELLELVETARRLER